MMKKVLIQLLSLVLAFALSLGVWAIGFYINVNLNGNSFNQLFNSLAIILMVLIVILAVINAVKNFAFNKRFNGMNAKEGQAYALEKKEEIQQNVAKAERNLNKKISLFNCYKCLLIVLFCATCLLLGLAKNQPLTTFIVIIAVFFNWSIINSFMPLPAQKINPKTILSPEEFPYIYSLINKASERVNYKGKILAVLAGRGVSIFENSKGVYLLFGSEEVSLFSEEELFSVLVHELEHLKNSDTKRRFRLHSFIEQNESQGENNAILDAGKTFFCSYFLKELLLAIIQFDANSSLERERLADLAVIEAGVEQDFINATAKTMLFALYGEHPWKEISFDTYKELTPITNFCQVNVACFLQKVELYGDKWHFTLQNELPSRRDSHPTLKMRMEALKVSEYKVDFTKKEGTYTQELDLLLQKSSSLITDLGFKNKKKDDYLLIRASAYDERIKAMNRYDKRDEWSTLTDSELIESAQAFLFIDDSKAERILREVVERSNSSFACYLLACLYAREYNDECIELFKKCAIDPTATNEAIDQLGKYALKTGNQKLLDEYRENAPNKYDFAEDEIIQTLFSKNGLEAPNESHQEAVNEIVEKLSEYWGNNLTAIYIGVRETESQTLVYYIAIDYNKKAPHEQTQTAYEETCYFINRLSKAGKKFYIFFGGKEFNTLKKLTGSKVYEKTADK